MLTTYVVDSLADEGDLSLAGTPDGQLTLREAVTAANADAAFGDAPAGSGEDTILFAPGIAGGTIELDGRAFTVTRDLIVDGGESRITLRPDGGSQNRTRLFNIQTSGEVTLRSLDLRDGSATGNGTTVRIAGDSRVLLEDVGVSGTNGGSAVFFDGALLNVAESIFTDNRAGVTVAAGEATFADTIFAENLNGIVTEDGSLTTLRTTFTDNSRAIDVRAGNAVLNESLFTGNRFAVRVEAGAAATVDASVFRENGEFRRIIGTGAVGLASGGAVTNEGRLEITGGIFEGNRSAAGPAVLNTGELTVTATEFVGNRAARNLTFDESIGRGGAIYTTGDASLTDVVLRENRADRDGGAVYVAAGELRAARTTFVDNVSRGRGGGVSIEAGATGRFPSAVFEGNTARFGGGVHNRGLSVLTFTRLIDNTAYFNGGGLHQDDDGSGAVTLIRAGRIDKNDAGLAGGGVSTAGGLMQIERDALFGVAFAGSVGGVGNTARNGAAIAAVGGGTQSRLRIERARIEANVASGSGGGVYVAEGQTAEVTDTLILRNLASESGGGLFAAAATDVSLTAVGIGDNLAGRSGGGIATRGRLSLADTAVEENRAIASAGGIFLSVGSELDVAADESFVSANESDGPGGGLFNAGTARLGGLRVRSNVASDGGGIFTATPGRTELENAFFQNNRPDDISGPGTTV